MSIDLSLLNFILLQYNFLKVLTYLNLMVLSHWLVCDYYFGLLEYLKNLNIVQAALFGCNSQQLLPFIITVHF